MLSVEGHEVVAEVAASPEERRIGLQGREQLPAGTGMLFDFGADGIPCMWMAETEIPLAAAFVAAGGRIEKIARMEPLDRTAHCAPRPVRYVLEVPDGWLAELGVSAGSLITGGPFGG